MDYQYPRLNKVFDFYNRIPHDASIYFLVGCQHLMEPQLKMFDFLIRFGFDPEKIIILGKAYSTNAQVLQELQNKKIKAVQPKFSGISFDQEHKNNCQAVLKNIPEDASLIILDDGGWFIKVSAQHHRKVVFGIEQTSSGFRNLEKEPLSFPVLNVARSVTKLTQEAPLVARHLSERVLTYLRQQGINNPVTLIVGLGPIGESILEAFKQNSIEVEGFDVKYGHTNLIEKIRTLKPDVVIGATGTLIITEEEIRNMQHPDRLFLISASSSDREFPVASFRSQEDVHDDVIYDSIIFVNNGFPFSFMGNRYEMTPIEIEKTICLLGGAVMHGCTKGVSGVGLQEIPIELENTING